MRLSIKVKKRKNVGFIISVLFIAATIGLLHNYLLNKISQKEKEFYSKRRIFEETEKKHDEILIQYDAAIDLEKIKNEMLKKGFKQTREIVYFKVENDKTDKTTYSGGNE